ncbi:MAG TPA: hypothetical protein VFZ00_32380 [Solirubrobacter sp.]|nr:hypothetical protein [Solirubrobacter sp.]
MSSAFARSALASLVALHGVAHLAGTTDLFSRAGDGRAAELLTGATADPLTLRTLGVAWAAVAVAYAFVAAVMWMGARTWSHALGWTTLASLLLVVISLWATVIGLIVDVTLLLVVAVVLVRGRRLAAAAR